MKTYAKSLIPLLGALFMLVSPELIGQAKFTSHDWINVANVAAGMVIAYVASNSTATVGRYAKEVGVAASAALVVLNNVVDGGVSTQEFWQIAVAVLVALGVVVAPTAPRAVLPGPGRMGDHSG